MTSSEPTSALPPPPGVTPNFSHPETLWKWDVLCVTICLVFTTIPFLLRTYVRLFLKRQWLFEDCKSPSHYYHELIPMTSCRYGLSFLGDHHSYLPTATVTPIDPALGGTRHLLCPNDNSHGQARWHSPVESHSTRGGTGPLCLSLDF